MSAADPATAWLPEKWQLLKKLGAGGMGEVWLARQRDTGRELAIKRLLLMDGDVPASAADRLRFKREFLILSKLDSPGIVKAYEINEQPALFYTMDYVAGMPIKQYMTSGAWRPGRGSVNIEIPDYFRQEEGLEAVRRQGEQLLGALAYLHANSFIHRDLKPDNLMVDEGGILKVIDFGLARGERDKADAVMAADLTGANQVMGTPHYLSPEQIRGQPLDGRCDLYAAGVILYELCCGQRPFSADSPHGLMLEHLQRAPLPPREVNPALPDKFNTLILRLLMKDPARRYATARDAHQALQGCAMAPAGHVPQVTSDSLTTPLAPPAVAPVAPSDLLAAPFIGNKKARDLLRAGCDALAGGDGGVLLVSGPAGSGKTRLTDEARAVAAEHKLWVLSGQSREEEGTAGDLFHDIMDTLAGEIRRRPEYQAQWLGPEGPLLAGYFPALRRVAGLEELAPAPLEAAGEKARVMAAVFTLFSRLADYKKIVLVLQDIHRADPLSLEITGHLIANFTGGRAAGRPQLYIVATHRNDPVGPAGEGSAFIRWLNRLGGVRLQKTVLAPLSEQETAVLAGAVLGLPSKPPARLVRHLHDLTGGNPFFILETLKALMTRGHLRRDDSAAADSGGWDFAGLLAKLQDGALRDELLPRSVQDCLQPRLEQLDEMQRSALQTAALIGREFKFAWWQAACGVAEDPLLETTEAAVRLGLLIDLGGDRLRFTNDQLRGSLLAELLSVRRNRLHARIVKAVEQDDPTQIELLAQHALDGNLAGAALKYCLPQAAALLRLCDSAPVLRLLERLETLFVDPPMPPAGRLEVIRLKCTALILQGESKQTAGLAREGITLARQLGESATELELWRRLSSTANHAGDYAASLEAVQNAIRIAGERGDEASAAWALFSQAVACKGLGETEAARSLFETSLQKAQRIGDQGICGNILNGMGIMAWESGELPLARQRFLEAFTAGRKAGDPAVMAAARSNGAEIDIYLGRLVAAEVELTAALALNREIGFRTVMVDNFNNLSQCRLLRGDPDAALALARQALDMAEQIGEPFLASFARLHIAKARHALNERPAASRDINAVVKEFQTLKYPFGEAVARTVKCRFALDAGKANAALIEADAVLQLAQSLQLKNTRALALSAMALARQMKGEPHDAAMYAEAIQLADASHHLEASLLCSLRQAQGLLLAGDKNAARLQLTDVGARAKAAQFVLLEKIVQELLMAN